MAERDGTSLNQFLATAIASRVGAEDLYTRLVQKLEQRFATTTANINTNPNEIVLVPAAIIPVTKIGIQRFEEMNNLTVDAAQVNPGPKARPRSERSTRRVEKAETK